MYQLFNTYTPNHGEIGFGPFRVLREMLEANLKKAMDYYRLNRTWINSSHPLVSLLMNVDVPLNQDVRLYSDKVEDRALELGQIHRYTSALSKGRMTNRSMFYGDHVAEAILITIDAYDIDHIEQDWRDYAPIRILRHPIKQLALWPLNGHNHAGATGISVASINLPMLATQYRCWRLQEGRDASGEEEAITTFLSRYPLTNALKSHYDLAFFNRLTAIFKGESIPAPYGNSPFWQLDLSHRTDKIIQGEIQTLHDRRITFDEILSQIPCISARCIGELFQIPITGIYNRQNIWLYALFRLPLIAFLVQQNAINGSQRNTAYLKQIRRFFIATGNDRDILSAIPYEERREVSDEIMIGILPYISNDSFASSMQS